MGIFIRLQGLPLDAHPVDIRHFFFGLSIPRGGVYVIGGELGEAFIVFETYEDARRAMCLSGGLIKKSHVQLSLSSQTEMQNAFEQSRAMKETISVEKPESLYLYVERMPLTTTKIEIKDFFYGLCMEDFIFLKSLSGFRNGSCVVKFATIKDANQGLKLHKQFMGSQRVTVIRSDEEQWVTSGGTVNKSIPKSLKRSPPRAYKDEGLEKRSRSKSPGKQRLRSQSPHEEFYVHIINLPDNADKKEIKVAFSDPELQESHIKFLLDEHGVRTTECFVMFRNEMKYKNALNVHKMFFIGRHVCAFPISKKSMLELIAGRKVAVAKENSLQQDLPKKNSQDSQSGKGKCVYLRNFPFDITKLDIQKFFAEFPINVEDIFLLHDDKGIGLGEALVKFRSEKEAASTEKMNRQRFLGTEVLLRCIPEEQMKVFGIDPVAKYQGHSSVCRKKSDLHVPATIDISDTELDDTEFMFDLDPTCPFNQNNGAKDEPVNASNVKNTNVAECQGEGSNHIPRHGRKPSGVALILIKNLPRNVTVAEILNFFHGYKVNSVNVKQNGGVTTGTAIVRMQNYEEAVSAVSKLNYRLMGLQKVCLSFIP
ncbi:hypothetical protein FKM82_005953 [Ascaphus truei]|uniref:RNA-binding protein 12B-like n=1 Tax=Ascaphus truei TaxID=8439 RepID=UPI003F5A8380